MRKKKTVSVSRTFKVHQHEVIDPLSATLWMELSGLDPRYWARFASLSLQDLKTLFDRLDVYPYGMSVDEARRRRQFTHCLKRYSAGASDLDELAEKAFIQIEEELTWKPKKSLLVSLNRIVRGWLRNLDLSDLPFQHGPGAVAEHGASEYDKWLAVDGEWDSLLDYTYREDRPNGPYRPVSRISRLIVVPKTSWKARTICAEPAALMFRQQGIQKRLYEHIARHPYLKDRIPLLDQTKNQRLAQIASTDRDRDDYESGWSDASMVTLDLSAASDRLPWAIVKEVFKGTTLLRHLWATRSKGVQLTSGAVMPLKKFAPMGSALCFPIQSLVYAAILEHFSRSAPTRYQTWSTYGDDLIYHYYIHQDVVDGLVSCGLKVNHEKSFTPETPFKESCGGDFFLGENITPVKLRSLSTDYASLLGLLDQLGPIWDRSARAGQLVKDFIVKSLPPHIARKLPIGENYGIPSREGEPSKYSLDWQRPLVGKLAPVLKTVSVLPEWYRYQTWLLRSRRSGRLRGSYTGKLSRVTSVQVAWS